VFMWVAKIKGVYIVQLKVEIFYHSF